MALYFCADVGGTRLKTALLDTSGVVVTQQVEPAPPRALAAVLTDRLTKHQAQAGQKARAAGVSIASVVDGRRTLTSTNLPYDPLDFEELASEWGIAVGADNDGHCMALGEWSFGAGQGCDDLVAVCVGTGVGGGIISGGRLVRGHRGAAAEVGHICVDRIGARPCPCGAVGCLETVGSARALEQHYAQVTGEDCAAVEVTQRARSGDKAAAEVTLALALWLGRGLAVLATLFDPQRVVLSGGLTGARDLLEAPLLEALSSGTYGRRFDSVPQVAWSPHADAAGLWGALVLAIEAEGGRTA